MRFFSLNKKTKIFVVSILAMIFTSLLFSNCSRTGFQVPSENQTDSLGSSAGNDAPAPSPTSAPTSTMPNDPCPILTLEQQKFPMAMTKSALTYGLKGDGKTDEYDAFQKLAADISGKQPAQRTIIYFPAGTYYINRFVRPEGANANKNQPINYHNAGNFSLIGCTNAIISVKGDFDMPNDTTSGTDLASYTMQVTPFRFENANNFKLSGFEINGNVDKMTRQHPAGTNVGETFSHGIVTAAAKNYEISHIKVHHFAADGVYIGDSPTVDDTGVYDDVESAHNARQGMSVIEARNLTIKNSIFRDTGFTDGTYPNHAPSAGVDVEPNWGPADGSLMTANITFDNCQFSSNLGSQWVGGDNGVNIENITIRNSKIIGLAGSTWPYVVIMSLPGGVIENNDINTYDGLVAASFSEGQGDVTKTNTIVRGNTITSSGVGLAVGDAGAQVVVENNTFISNHKPTSDGPFPSITAGALRVTGNKVNYPSKNFGSKNIIGIMVAPTFTGNTITTDLATGNYTVKVSPGASASANTIGAHILLGQ